MVSPQWLKDNLSNVVVLDTSNYEFKETDEVPSNPPTLQEDLMSVFNFLTGKTATADKSDGGVYNEEQNLHTESYIPVSLLHCFLQQTVSLTSYLRLQNDLI